MSEPLVFASTTPRLGLPNLFAAQAQKEFTVNEAFGLIDALLHPVVQGVSNDPPPTPNEGECWIVGSQPTGEWAGYARQIACCQSGNWLLVSPLDGMVAFDRSARRTVRFSDEWTSASAIAIPKGGATVDTEARGAIAEIVTALTVAGILKTE